MYIVYKTEIIKFKCLKMQLKFEIQDKIVVKVV